MSTVSGEYRTARRIATQREGRRSWTRLHAHEPGWLGELRACQHGSPAGAANTTVAQVARTAMLLYLAVRLIHVAQGIIAVATGFEAYHPPVVAVATLLVTTCLSAWIAAEGLRGGAHAPRMALLDAATSIVGIIALGAATLPSDRTTSLNWMLPYSVGAAVGLAVSMPNVRGAIISVALAAVYVMTTWQEIMSGGGPAATALANTASYLGFFIVMAIALRFVNRLAAALDAAQQLAIEKRQRQATASERRKHQRLIHDSVLQTLEAMGAGMAGDEAAMRRRARAEAVTLRLMLEDHPGAGAVRAAMAALSNEPAIYPLQVDVVGQESAPEPSPRVAAALLAAAREALVNTAKHGEVSRAVVRIRAADGGLEVVVRDEGKGFDMENTRLGFGTIHSIQGRLAEVGGSVTISSHPGLGTRVRMWGPLA